jgi:hypothetical protein
MTSPIYMKTRNLRRRAGGRGIPLISRAPSISKLATGDRLLVTGRYNPHAFSGGLVREITLLVIIGFATLL